MDDECYPILSTMGHWRHFNEGCSHINMCYHKVLIISARHVSLETLPVLEWDRSESVHLFHCPPWTASLPQTIIRAVSLREEVSQSASACDMTMPECISLCHACQELFHGLCPSSCAFDFLAWRVCCSARVNFNVNVKSLFICKG